MRKYFFFLNCLLFPFSSIILAQGDNSDIFEDDPAQVIPADKHGSFLLLINESTYSGFSLGEREEGIYTSQVWRTRDAFAKWVIDVPSAGEYILEAQWGKPHTHECIFDIHVNGTPSLKWVPGRTSHWISYPFWHRNSAVVGKITLPRGKVEIRVSASVIPDAVDVAGFRFVPSEGYEEKTKALRSGSRLGLSLYEMELLYGPGMRRKQTSAKIGQEGSPGDEDRMLYQSIANKTQRIGWAFNNMKMLGYFYMDKCVGLEFDIWEDNSREAAWTVAKTMVPNVEFNTTRIPANGKFTTYSKDKKYKFQYWESEFEIKDSALVRQLRIKEMEDLKAFESSPRIGLSEQNLQTIWGEGTPVNNYNIVVPKADGNKEKDWELPFLIKPYINARRWTMGGARSMVITAAFWKDKCVWIDVRYGNKSAITPDNCDEFAKYILPGIRFSSFRGNANSEFVEYSTKPSRAFKMRKWFRGGSHYVEIFGMNVIRSLVAQDLRLQKKDAETLTKAIYSLPNSERASLFGAKKEDVERMLGQPVKCKLNNHGFSVYGIPGCNMKLLIKFAHNTASEINIIYDNGVLSADAGLLVAQALLGKTPLPQMTEQQRKSWFLVKSADAKARYSIQWFLNNDWGVMMKLKDNQLPAIEDSKVKSLLDAL